MATGCPRIFNDILDEIIGELTTKISEINENIEQLKSFRD